LSGPATSVTVLTAASPGAVGIIQLHGKSAAQLASKLTGRQAWPVGRVALADLGGIDQGLVVALRNDWIELMPHGGPRVIGRLVDRLTDLGARYDPQPAARQLYPEARSDLEADMLLTLSRAASSAAIDLLLAQPSLWRQWAIEDRGQREAAETILARSRTLDRLIDPPTVVVVGRPNVGKSTLTNCVLGREASVVAHLPGTTRDWVAGLAELRGAEGPGVAVRWLDTPGLRDSDDPIELAAIALAQQVIHAADVLIAMRDSHTDWPVAHALGRDVDLWIMGKADLLDVVADGDGRTRDAPLALSALTGSAVDRLLHAVLDHLQLTELEQPSLWAFSQPLCDALARNDIASVELYTNS